MAISAPPRMPATRVPDPVPPRRRRRGIGGASATRTLMSDSELGRGRVRVAYFSLLTLVTVLFVAVFIFPLCWMIASAVKKPSEFALSPPTIVPQSFEPHTYADAWTQMRIARYFANTVCYAIGGWLIQLVVAVTAAYALSRLRPVLGRAVLGMMLASLMLPAAALLVPAYLTVSDVPLVGVNLLNTPWALWLPMAANAFNIYILKRFFDQIPGELIDSASVDGAGALRILWNIVLPLSRPVLGVVSIFAIIGIWKDFLWPFVVLQHTEVQTLSVALSRLSNTSQVPATEMMAGMVIASIPMVVLFLIFQRSIISGLSAGAVKG